ncbi:ketoacyl-ACP synthase III family protein [Actinomadura barringtoniae]|uniref:Ketoacyl-ACP synthase III family protein n=1 Tax=Actinomadura barringtoniae TaxID=1427535 RepID=A0A939P5P5_9ACTN|nr:ketoacyl-ACP synthase III family protein [Actinomadura barringtoniae]MBO2445655.1 ketoacyl-ACP synthase III family protein [Actinomadura barringtoniae]
MRCDGLFLAGLAHRLPATMDVDGAVADGRYDRAEQEADAYASVTVATDEAPPEMAVAAARLALGRAGTRPSDVALVLHASAWFQGVDYWPPAAYVHREVLGEAGRYAPAMDVQQMCAGAMGAVELAASYLAADASRQAALVTTADRYADPGFDRWRSDVRGIVYGDGAASAVIGREGFARLLSVSTVVDTELEGMYRGDEPFAVAPGRKVDVRARREAFAATARARLGSVADRTTSGLTDAVGRTLDEAGLKVDDIARFVFPNVGLFVLRTRYAEPLGVDLERTTWDWGRRTGHVGAADQLTGLTHLVESGAVTPGDRVLLVGIGAGFAWTCATVEITESPDWNS